MRHLLCAHLQTENGDGSQVLVVDGHVLSDGQDQARLPHARPAGYDDQIRLLKPTQDLIQIGEAGGNAAQFPLMLVQVLDLIEVVAQEPPDRDQIPCQALLSN